MSVTLTFKCTRALWVLAGPGPMDAEVTEARAPSAHLASAPPAQHCLNSLVSLRCGNSHQAQTVLIMTLLKRLSFEYPVCFLRFALS